MKSNENREKEETKLEEMIKKEIRSKIGLGLFMSAAKQREEEAKIREKYRDEAKKIQDRYTRTEAKLTESMKKLLLGMVEEAKKESGAAADASGGQIEEKGAGEKQFERAKTRMLEEDGIQDLQAIDMKKMANRAKKYLPPEFVVLDLHVEVPCLGFSLVNEYAQNVLEV